MAERKTLARRPLLDGPVLGGLALLLLAGACSPTVRVEVAPINIYAKLDADVRVRLDREVQTLISENPDLF